MTTTTTTRKCEVARVDGTRVMTGCSKTAVALIKAANGRTILACNSHRHLGGVALKAR